MVDWSRWFDPGRRGERKKKVKRALLNCSRLAGWLSLSTEKKKLRERREEERRGEKRREEGLGLSRSGR